MTIKTMKRHVFLPLLFIMPLLLFLSCGEEQKPEPLPESVSIQYLIGGSGGSLEGRRAQKGKPGDPMYEIRAIPKLGYEFAGWSDGVTDPVRTGTFGDADAEIYANFRMQRMELPIVTLTTATGGDVTSKTDYISAVIGVSNTGCADFEIGRAEAEIRGRGNATWTLMEKKSYRIRFAEKQQLLGLGTGKSRTWILMANHCDQSLLRNYLSIYMANRLTGIGYNSSGTFVDVYLNGEYRGVYLLAEQVQEGEFRIDLGRDALPDPTVADAGFLIELDNYAEGDGKFGIGSRPYEIKSEILSQEQYDYAVAKTKELDEALSRGNYEEIDRLLDLSSAVDGYLLEEFFKNIDVGWSSFYFYKLPGENEKIHLGPFWDFDLSAGNDLRLDDASYEKLYVGADTDFTQSHRWFVRLMRCEWFRKMAAERWEEIRPIVEDTIEEAGRVTEAYSGSLHRNFEKWDIFGKRINQEPAVVMALKNYDEHTAYLIHWLEGRAEWLDSEFRAMK